MNKIEKFFASLDVSVDRHFGSFKSILKQYFPIVSTMLLVVFVVLFVLRFMYTRPYMIASLIDDDIKLISLSLEKIDERCSILSVDENANQIDFLNVKSFVGSRVGPLNLVYADRWEGPYLQNNPTLQNRFYELVKVRDGYFIIPGHGVRLPNGKIVGKDIKISSHTKLTQKIEEGGDFTYKGIPLAAKIKFIIGDWDNNPQPNPAVQRLEKLNELVEEFNEAMPFTKNDEHRDSFIDKGEKISLASRLALRV